MEPFFKKKVSEEEIDKLLKLKRKAPFTQIGWQGTLFMAALSLVMAFILIPRFTLPRKTFVAGELAPIDIKANRSFEITDERATQKLKDTAESNSKSIYDYDPKLYAKTVKKLFTGFERMKKEYYIGPGKSLDPSFTREAAKKAFEEALGRIQVEEDVFTYLENTKFNWRISWTINRLSNLLKNKHIIADKGILGPEVERGIIIHEVEDKKEYPFDDFVQILDVGEAKRKIRIGTPKIYKVYKADAKKFVATLAESLVFPNFSYNTVETNSRREAVMSEIKPIIIMVDKGDVIIRKGDPVQKYHLVILDGIRKQFTEQRPGLFVFFTAIFLFFFFQILGYFSLSSFTRFRPTRRDVITLGVLVTLFLLGVRGYLFFAGAIGDKFIWLPPSLFLYLIPVAAGAMMARFLIGLEASFIFAIVMSVTLGLLLEKNFLFAIYALSSCFVGIQSVAYCRALSDIYKAGLRVAIANVAVVFSIVILSSLGRSATYEEIMVELVFGVGAGFLAGIISSVLVVTITPIFEYLFGYTTDVKLLELSNLNNPVLRDLMIRAPGSYHHCIMVGTLAEHAAEAVGCDALLARVGGYYHDIGKMKNPHYYIENQFGGFNIHDRQPPHLSRTMIMSHVKAGVRIGTNRKLGQRVIDIIAQHHGTTLMLFFFQKAKSQLEKKEKEKETSHEHSKVDEQEYRYSGPTPQTVEAAIVMMADSVEAATRAMNTSNLPRLRAVCEKIVNRLFTDGQLEDCDLTLRDLNTIIESFYHVLIGVYHRRISYPGGVKAEQPYDANYYPRQTKEEAASKEEDSDLDEHAIHKKMGSKE